MNHDRRRTLIGLLLSPFSLLFGKKAEAKTETPADCMTIDSSRNLIKIDRDGFHCWLDTEADKFVSCDVLPAEGREFVGVSDLHAKGKIQVTISCRDDVTVLDLMNAFGSANGNERWEALKAELSVALAKKHLPNECEVYHHNLRSAVAYIIPSQEAIAPIELYKEPAAGAEIYLNTDPNIPSLGFVSRIRKLFDGKRYVQVVLPPSITETEANKYLRYARGEV